MLARTTVAGQEGVIEYLANSSALQHFEQTALAYLLLQKAGRAVSATQLASDTEGLLEDRFGVSMATLKPGCCVLCKPSVAYSELQARLVSCEGHECPVRHSCCSVNVPYLLWHTILQPASLTTPSSQEARRSCASSLWALQGTAHIATAVHMDGLHCTDFISGCMCRSRSASGQTMP